MAGAARGAAIRFGIRRLCRQRLLEIEAADCERSAERLEQFVETMRRAPVAPVPQLANDQHYELPEALFAAALGPHRKYSCCYWADGVETLADAERAALELTCERAAVVDGQRILELGWRLGPGPGLDIGAARDGVAVVSYVDVAPKTAALDLLRQLAQKSRGEQGNVRFVVLQHLQRGNHFTVVQQWRSDAALDEHVEAAHTREYRDALQPLTGSPLDERVYTPLAR